MDPSGPLNNRISDSISRESCLDRLTSINILLSTWFKGALDLTGIYSLLYFRVLWSQAGALWIVYMILCCLWLH